MNENICCIHPEAVANAKENLLKDELTYEVADFFKMLGDSTRIKILYTLSSSEMCVGDLAESLAMTQSAVSHQLRVLKQSGLVKFKRVGKVIYYSLDDDHVTVVLKQGLEHICHKKDI